MFDSFVYLMLTVILMCSVMSVVNNIIERNKFPFIKEKIYKFIMTQPFIQEQIQNILKEEEHEKRMRLYISSYKLLGLSSNASKQDLKKAYRKMAKKYHPDHNKHPNAKANFQKIKTAYECLEKLY